MWTEMVKEDAEKYFDLLIYEFFVLRIEWRLYRSFFGTNKETVDLLNEISGPTANSLERILFERCLLGIRRITDKSVGPRGRTRSVTIMGLSERFDGADVRLRKLVGVARKRASFARNWADKKIAHADLDFRSGNATLETASRQKVEEALDAIASILKYVSLSYFESTLGTHPMPSLDDERRFLEVLYLGQKAMREDEEKRAQLFANSRYAEFDALERRADLFPDWLKREDPPIDVP